MRDLDQIVREFVVESRENLASVERDLVSLEKDPTNQALLEEVFRYVHSIKGSSGFLAFNRLESVTHGGENLLAQLRDGSIQLSQGVTDVLLMVVDAIREILDVVETEGNDGDNNYTDLLARLKAFDNPESVAQSDANERPTVGDAAISVGEDEQEALDSAEQNVGPTDGDSTVSESGRPNGDGLQVAADSTIRVDVSLLDKLMNLVGELVLARNQVLQHTGNIEDSVLTATVQRLNLITTELQAGVMKTRMQPIGNVWSKFPRVVRDLATNMGKLVRLQMEGKETELDKTLIEAIKDPLTHIVRNSVGHGIERAAERKKAGKSPEATIRLRAYHEGGQVNVEISDDGTGIDTERVKAKAVQRNLITVDQAQNMSDREATNLIFRAGFSTAAETTSVSGRGVGMDVVKTNIERIGGTVDVQSEFGQGTTIKIKIPLTLAIIPALIVRTDGDHYAIPQASLLELVRLEGEKAQTAVEMIHGAPVYRLRGSLLPLVYLDQELKVRTEEEGAAAREVINIVVLQADGRQFGLVVDAILDTEEIVVKPLGAQLKGMRLYAGATVAGDGSVALILDAIGLAYSAKVVSETLEGKMGDSLDGASGASQVVDERDALLLFNLGKQGRLAVPLSTVSRLEEILATDVEYAGRQAVVQYRGEIMPLVQLDRMLHYSNGDHNEIPETLQVVVHSRAGRSIGIIVDDIVDIVEEKTVVDTHAPGEALLGSTVIQGRVTDMLDLDAIIEADGRMTTSGAYSDGGHGE